jgi:Pentapeptide repeats (8 copies)
MLRFRTARHQLRELVLVSVQEVARKLLEISQLSQAAAPSADSSSPTNCNWVREPTISGERQQELRMRLQVKPDVRLCQYPFARVKLSRGDIEWLLLTHDNGLGPVDWKSPARDERWGLDLRGADISGADLQELPLSRLRGGVSGPDWDAATQEQRDRAAVIAQGTVFTYAHLEGAVLTHAHLEGAKLNNAHLEDIDAFGINLGGPVPANLYGAYLSPSTKLYRAVLANKDGVGPRLMHVHWNDALLDGIEWDSMRLVSDEYHARRSVEHGGASYRKSRDTNYEDALLTYRQLSAVLASQGLNEESAKFARRAKVVQCILFFRRGQVLRYAFSLMLNVTTGYGYSLWRSVITYGVTIAAFACAYYFLATGARVSLSAVEATVLSMTSFHGRGFTAAENVGLSNPISILGATEALVGLIIEIILIATVTHRFFGK